MSEKKPDTDKGSRTPDKPKSKEGGQQQSKKPEKSPEKETNKKEQKPDQKAVQKAVPKIDPKDSQKESAEDAPKAPQKDVQKNAPKANKDTKKDVQKNVQKPSAKNDAKDVSKDSPKDTNKDDEKDDSIDNHADPLPDDDAETAASVKEQRLTSKISPDDINILREIIRRQLEDEGHAHTAISQGHPAARQVEQLYAPPSSSSGVVQPGPSSILDFYGRGAAASLPFANVFGSCNCHAACNCQKPCLCKPSPCPCKGPGVSSVRGCGSGTLISSVVPIPIPYPVPSYDGGAGASGSARPNEPVIINAYQPSTSSSAHSHHVPPAPANADPTSVHDVVSLMKRLMLKKFRDDLLREWGLPVPSAEANVPVEHPRHPAPEGSVLVTAQVCVYLRSKYSYRHGPLITSVRGELFAKKPSSALQEAEPGQALVSGPAPSLPQYVFQQPGTIAPYFGGQRPPYNADLLARLANEPRVATTTGAPRRRHHTGGHKHTATGKRADEQEGIESPETPELSAQTGSRGSKGPRSKGSRRGRK
ncbi:uncharacterized protein LOC142817477 [Rhipicephalus microplus]|uniref:uncharacterized protein LOC142817477 n=1 Tax=Rhipicephalus microplus TaxID=6941 RepID=UPI003F6D397D